MCAVLFAGCSQPKKTIHKFTAPKCFRFQSNQNTHLSLFWLLFFFPSAKNRNNAKLKLKWKKICSPEKKWKCKQIRIGTEPLITLSGLSMVGLVLPQPKFRPISLNEFHVHDSISSECFESLRLAFFPSLSIHFGDSITISRQIYYYFWYGLTNTDALWDWWLCYVKIVIITFLSVALLSLYRLEDEA